MLISSATRVQSPYRAQIREAISEGDWLNLKYAGEDRVVIPQKLEKSSQGNELLCAVLADSSQFRTFRTDRIQSLALLPDSDQDPSPQVEVLAQSNPEVAKLQQAVSQDLGVSIGYRMPGLDQPITMSLDPNGFDIQPDGSLALEATNSKGLDRKFRLDRICSVDLES